MWREEQRKMYNESMVIVMSMQTAAPAEFFQRLPVPWWGRSRPGNTRWSSGQTRCRTRRTEEIRKMILLGLVLIKGR